MGSNPTFVRISFSQEWKRICVMLCMSGMNVVCFFSFQKLCLWENYAPDSIPKHRSRLEVIISHCQLDIDITNIYIITIYMSICIFRLEPSSRGSCSCRNKLSGQSSPLFPLVHESTASIKDTSRESVKECQVNILNGWMDG